MYTYICMKLADRNCSLEFGRFLHCEFRNPLAAIWAVSCGGVGYFSNERGFSVESNLQRISSMKNSDFSCVEIRYFFRKWPMRCGSPNASPEVVHRPRSQSPLHFDIRNI